MMICEIRSGPSGFQFFRGYKGTAFFGGNNFSAEKKKFDDSFDFLRVLNCEIRAEYVVISVANHLAKKPRTGTTKLRKTM